MKITIKEVLEKHRTVSLTTQLFGQAQPYAKEYAARLGRLGEAVCREQKVSIDKGFNLPLTTVLGEESLALYRDLNAWIVGKPPLQ